MCYQTSTGERTSMSRKIIAIEKETGKKFPKERIEEMVNLLGFDFSLELEGDLEDERTKTINNPEILKVHTVLCTEYIEKLKKVLEEFKDKIANTYLHPLRNAIAKIEKEQKDTLWAIEESDEL